MFVTQRGTTKFSLKCSWQRNTTFSWSLLVFCSIFTTIEPIAWMERLLWTLFTLFMLVIIVFVYLFARVHIEYLHGFVNAHVCVLSWAQYYGGHSASLHIQPHTHTHTHRGPQLQPADRWPSLQSADVLFPPKPSTLSQQSSAEEPLPALLLLWDKWKSVRGTVIALS